MATCRNVFLCTYVLVGILHIHETTSAAINISRNVCFEKALAFVKKYHVFQWCDTFSARDVMNDFGGDGNTCKKFCKVTVNDIYNYGHYYLETVKLKLDDYYIVRTTCYPTYPAPGRALLLICNSVETGLFWSKSNFGDNRQCFEWTQYYSYVCWCKHEFVLINGNCLRGGKLVGETCESDLQCTGSEHSGLCSDGVCSCQNGYFQHDMDCYLENVLEAGRCVVDKQCTEIGNMHSARICVDGRCDCKEGYALIEHTCHEVNLSLNESCIVNDQCSGSPYASCLERKCSCIQGYIAEDSTFCVLKKAVEVGNCVDNLQCNDNKSKTSNRVCIDGRCVCGDGYALIERTCLEVNLSLNMICIVNDQCLGSPFASCVGGKCSCIEGYTAVNSTDCVLSQHVLNETSLQTFLESTSNNMGPIIGALSGGLLLGVIITSGTVYLIYRRSNYCINERKGPRVTFAVNDAYGGVGHDDTVKNTSTNKTKDKQKKVFNVSPLTRSEEWSEYSNTSGTVTAMDDVYNHLNEKEKTQDEDTYDHACAAAGRGHRDLDDYSNINGMDDDVVSGGTNNDDYSTLRQT